MGEAIAPVMQEDFAVLDGDFLQRLQAVRDETRIDDRYPLHAFAGEPLDRLVGVGLAATPQVRSGTGTSLEPLLAPAEPLPEQSRGLLAVAVVGIALVEIHFGRP